MLSGSPVMKVDKGSLLVIFDNLHLWFCGLAFVLFWGCGEIAVDDEVALGVATEQASTNQALLDSLSIQLPGGPAKADSRDSVIENILPLLLADPADRLVLNWYEIRTWVPLFGDVESLLFYLSVEAETAAARGEKSEASRILNSMGRIYNAEGNFLKGGRKNEEAYEIAREIGDSLVMVWTQINLSEAFIFGRDSERARRFLDQAMDLSKAIKDYGAEAAILIRIGASYSFLGDHEAHLFYSEMAMALTEKHNLSMQKRYALLNLCLALNKLGKPREAIKKVQESVVLKGAEKLAIWANINQVMFESYLMLEDNIQARKHLEEAYRAAMDLSYFFAIWYCKEAFSRLQLAEGKPEEALVTYRDYHQYYDENGGADAKLQRRSLEIQQINREKDWEINRLEQKEKERILLEKSGRDKLLSLIGAVFFLLISSFSWFFFQSKVVKARQQRKIAEAKLQVLQSQMNPHFIYNAMNGIQNYILKSEKYEAYAYLGKFAELLRIITKSSANVSIELEQEVKLLKTYLELEKLRWRDQFDYELYVCNDLLNENHNLPSMMIQPIVENAILHGISGLPYKGELSVRITPHKNGVKCVVRDNGRGREAATHRAGVAPSQHLSIASVNTLERLEFLRNIGYEDANVEIEDLKCIDDICGTVVTIYLPNMLAENTATIALP